MQETRRRPPVRFFRPHGPRPGKQATSDDQFPQLQGLILATTLALGAAMFAQTGQRPMSPDGSAQVQVLGKWVKGTAPPFRSDARTTRAASGSKSPTAVRYSGRAFCSAPGRV